MNETLIIDLITNKPTIDDTDDDDDDDDEDNADDMAQVVQDNNNNNNIALNVNQQADFHVTFNVTDKIIEKEKLDVNEIILETTTTKTTTTIINAIKEQKEIRLNAQEKKVTAEHNKNNSNLTDKQVEVEEEEEKLSKKLLKTSMSLYKDIEEKAQHEEQHQQQIKMQIYNNNNNNKDNNVKHNNNNNVASNQYSNLKTLNERDERMFLVETDIDENFMSVSTEAVNENFFRTNDYDNVDEKKKENEDVVGHNADNYWTKSNRLDNANDKRTTEATITITTNNCENNTIDDDYLIESTITTTIIMNEKIDMMKVDKFILNDRQIDSTTIEKVEQNLMEINEQMLIANSTEKEQHMQSNIAEKMEANDELHNDNDDDDDDGNELNKLTPQHLLLDELMLNDGGIEGGTELVNKGKEKDANPYVVNYIDSGSEDIDIVSLEDKQSMSTDELFYKTLPAPQVLESFDKPNKRILVNVTIATDDADGSVYTLHVALPTGRGHNDERNIEQVLTHERRRTDPPPALPYC